MVEETDAEGKTSIKTYDALNRATSIQYSNASYNVYFYYDEASSSYGAGRLTSVQDSSGTKRINYFRTGFIKDEVVEIGASYYTTAYTYNKNGNIKSIVYPSGRQVWYNLDVRNGKPESINAIIDGESRGIITGAEYLPFGSIKSLDFSNGLNLQRSYDLKYRLTSNTNGQINTNYVYDNEYNILSISGSYNRAYSYDDIYRLVSATGVWGTEGYTYDRNGNRLSKNENGFITIYSYQTGTNRLIQTGGYEEDNFTYNENGSIVSDSKHTYQYGDNGHMVSIDSGTTARYFYDYEMRRRKAVYQDKTILFFYDIEGKLISEKDLSTGYWRDYIYIDLEPIARVDQRPPWIKIGDSYLRADKTGGKVHLDWTLYSGSENFRVYYTVNDFTFTNPSVLQETPDKTYDHDVLNDGNNYAYRIFKNVPDEGLYFYHCDHLMTSLQMTDENQSVVWQADYYPFGKIYSFSAEIENNLRFPGQYEEKGSNLYYNWHRYYSPKIGRYLKVDQIILASSTKPYNYSDNNPIIFSDPLGLKECSKCDQCPKGKWRIEDWTAGINFKIGKSTVSWTAKIHCMSRRPGEYIVSPLEYYPVKIECEFAGIDIGGSIGIGGGTITDKCNIYDIYNEIWKGIYFSPPILPISGFYTKSDSGSTFWMGYGALSLEIGGGYVKCKIK